ncbi:hypothetical protein [Streptomyces sioyaensis]|uniref:hypothetical protein n=1 Tax=Streptomyces sioyaensis TaxID=67364 RepID=UPI00379AD68E
MITAVRAQQDCLLSYALSTNPNPLTVSPPDIAAGAEDEHAFADIDLVISNSGNTPVRCSKIAIVLPIGSLAQDLAVTGEGIDAYVSPESGWTVIDVQSDVLLAVPMAETAVFNAAGSSTIGSSQVRFDVVPSSGGESEVTVDGLYIHLSGIKVSDKTGITRIGIEEWAAYEDDPIGEANTLTLDVAKFPFRSGSDPHPGIGRALVALTGTGQDPATKIAAGDLVVLEWHHLRGDNHELYADGRRLGDTGPELEQIAGGSRWEIPDGLQRDTTFALKTVTPTPDAGFVVRWDHVTVCVTDPTLAKLTVTGEVQAKSTLKAGATTVGSLDAGSGEIKTTGVLKAGATTVGSLDAGSGEIKTTGVLKAGATTVGSLDAGSGEIKTTGVLKAGATTVGSLNSGSGEIKTTGKVSGGSVTAGGKDVVKMDTQIAIQRNTKIRVNGVVETFYLELENKSAWGHWAGIYAWGTPESDGSRGGRAFRIVPPIGNRSDVAGAEEGRAEESTTPTSEVGTNEPDAGAQSDAGEPASSTD